MFNYASDIYFEEDQTTSKMIYWEKDGAELERNRLTSLNIHAAAGN